jgi:hypothetical protein
MYWKKGMPNLFIKPLLPFAPNVAAYPRFHKPCLIMMAIAPGGVGYRPQQSSQRRARTGDENLERRCRHRPGTEQAIQRSSVSIGLLCQLFGRTRPRRGNPQYELRSHVNALCPGSPKIGSNLLLRLHIVHGNPLIQVTVRFVIVLDSVYSIITTNKIYIVLVKLKIFSMSEIIEQPDFSLYKTYKGFDPMPEEFEWYPVK